jgi:glycine dehydrogenase
MPLNQPLSVLEQHDEFIDRHIGPCATEIAAMLAAIGVDSLDQLIDQTVPAAIRLPADLPLPAPRREHEALADLKALASKNIVNKSCIGMGYYDTLTPKVILRNVMENPGWYTAYTPYQAEIAQGRLEALMNFQQMVVDLTGLEIANASLLDEATAAAEAMTMARRVSKSKSNRFLVDAACFPQTIDVVKTRAAYFGFELVIAAVDAQKDEEFFGALLQYPNDNGEVRDLSTTIAGLKAKGATIAVATDLMALVLLKSPGTMGADIALGSSQRFGIPMGFGGPHAAFFATREAFVRSMPGRIIGVSKDARGNPAYRMALQTREQHIRREKANSNICTSQVLLANMAGMFAVYHGPQGLKTIAGRIHRLTGMLAEGLKKAGIKVLTATFFDTIRVKTEKTAAGYNFRPAGNGVQGISFDETTSITDVATLLHALTGQSFDLDALDAAAMASSPLAGLLRSDAVLQHPVFNTHHTEHEMLRYLKSLQNKDLALDHSMISLGSCTMKLNATSEMIPVTWPEFGGLHPFAPRDQAVGYLEMIAGLTEWLKTVTGFDAICMQPNSGAQGEYAGLVAIDRYHASRGEEHRNVCLIPKSAHGTNPATAQMANMKVVVVDCDDNGNVDVVDLKAKAEEHKDDLACLMITYPSTHGVFEEAVRDICAIVHKPRRPGVHGRRQPQRPGRPDLARLYRRRRQPHEPAQDLRHPARRRRTGHGPDRPQGPSGTVHGRPRRRSRPARTRQCRPGCGCRRPVRLGLDPDHFLDVPRHARWRRRQEGDASCHPQRQLRRPPAQRALSRALRRQERPRRPRVHPRHPPDQGRHRHRRDRHRQAPDGLRFPCADGVFPGRRHDHGRADGIRIEGRTGPLHRCVDRHSRGNPPDRNGVWTADNNPLKNAPHSQADVIDATGSTRTAANRPSSRCLGWLPTSSGRASIASTTCTATAT